MEIWRPLRALETLIAFAVPPFWIHFMSPLASVALFALYWSGLPHRRWRDRLGEARQRAVGRVAATQRG
jgi:hypothetical protein